LHSKTAAVLVACWINIKARQFSPAWAL